LRSITALAVFLAISGLAPTVWALAPAAAPAAALSIIDQICASLNKQTMFPAPKAKTSIG